MRFCLISLFILSVPGVASAESNIGYMPGIGRLVVAMAIVLSLIFISVRLFRRLVLSKGSNGTGYIRLIDSYPLHQKARLNMVEVAGRIFLISVTDGNVSLIAEYDRSELDIDSGQKGNRTFLSYLDAFRRDRLTDKKASAS